MTTAGIFTLIAPFTSSDEQSTTRNATSGGDMSPDRTCHNREYEPSWGRALLRARASRFKCITRESVDCGLVLGVSESA